MKKIIYWVVGILVVAGIVWALWPSKQAAAQTVLECPVGQIAQAPLITPEVIAAPAQTHIVHHDAVTNIVHHEAVYSCPVGYENNPGHSNCRKWVVSGYWHSGHWHDTSDWVYANKVKTADAYDETVIITEAYDETIIDVAAVIGSEAVYGDPVCVTDPDYVAPTPSTPSAPAKGQSGGGRQPVQIQRPDGTTYWYCPSPLSPSNDPYRHCPNSYPQVSGNSGITGDPDFDLLKKLLGALQQLLPLLQQLQIMKG